MASRYIIDKLKFNNPSLDISTQEDLSSSLEAILATSKFIKGGKGDKPVKGVDYFTEEDKTEMEGAVYVMILPILNAKQDALESGVNIKTVNDATLLEGGNINLIESDDVRKVLRKTQEEYDAIQEKDENTLYIIVDKKEGGVM